MWGDGSDLSTVVSIQLLVPRANGELPAVERPLTITASDVDVLTEVNPQGKV